MVGLGRLGGLVLKAFKMRMFEEFPTDLERNRLPVALLYVDSTDEMMPQNGLPHPSFSVMGQDASFTRSEFLNIKTVDVEHILEHINSYPALKGIVENVDNSKDVSDAIGQLGSGDTFKRRANRLLFGINAVAYVNALRNAFSQCQSSSENTCDPCISIFAGLSDGTGSGTVIDAVVQARKAFPLAYINVYALLLDTKSEYHPPQFRGNTYAALAELNALQAGRWSPYDVTGIGRAELYNYRIKGVADGVLICSNAGQNGLLLHPYRELPRVVSDFLFAQTFMPDCYDNECLKRIMRFGTMDDRACEYDETANADEYGRIPVARTKKLASFGIKRVVYPELRILKHITYTAGKSVLYQFLYNNWQDSQGYVCEERNKDYRKEYLHPRSLSNWMLDIQHLTYEAKVLESDADYPMFSDYWHDKAIDYAEDAKKAKCPLEKLDDIMAEFYTSHFREEGVESYYACRVKQIPEIAREIRRGIETDLFKEWKDGDASIHDMQKVSSLLLGHMKEIRTELETLSEETSEEYEACNHRRQANVDQWHRLGILQKMAGASARRYADHQEILAACYTAKTMLIALEFARQLAAKVSMELGRMDADILSFAQKISEAIEETERLVTAHTSASTGQDAMPGVFMEVCEDEPVAALEKNIITDKIDMYFFSRRLRESILPEEDVAHFGRLANEISVDDIKDVFDVELSAVVRAKHDEMADIGNEVLGLNILAQLEKKLRTDDDIKKFADNLISQSGTLLNLNNDQLQLHLRNNEGWLSPDNPASRNRKVLYVSIPAPDENAGLGKFADKLEDAIKNTFYQNDVHAELIVDRRGASRKEILVLTYEYLFPMRAIEGIEVYKKWYDDTLYTHNPRTNAQRSVDIHTEMCRRTLPSIMPLSDQSSPSIKLYVAVGESAYGPYTYEECRIFVAEQRIVPNTLVWMPDIPAWTEASQVPLLQELFQQIYG